ncbi:unnamed protein product [Caenorhabditis sp. 36 PRJEB53466]|nr:unnamed protein product [Caenorhabditis sp. 36 PRJEB53466]
MTYSNDRELLLHQGDLRQIVRMFEVYCANPSHFHHVKKERLLSRAVFFIVGFFCVVFSVNQYKISMEGVESRECNDALADCDGIPFNDTLIPPFYNYLQDFTVTRRYDISLCLIPKVMSTIGTAALCYIDNPEAFKSANRTISNEMYAERFCERNEMKSYEMVKYNLKRNFENIIVVRDPFDRFISGFTEKCVKYVAEDLCHGCGRDLHCFIRKEYRRLKRISMLFPVYTLADTHFAPQTWFCDMKNTLKDSTLIRYSNSGMERVRMVDDIMKVFSKRKVAEEDMRAVQKELSKGKTIHSTAGSSLRQHYERLIREDSAIRRAIVRMYYYDFLLFGYSM